ncbi:hypothetical protein Pan216_19830 [Planctomycetes bacterium Pan216]|uniref:NfeD-like C-terminal domain-containing protein n=1 Tax=Kolteria novifilia TaxID=2527975 RepID=A0A518B2B5_9BACT|nr:hypothetical protein Pan216_19830 [Planctomycetes bacterium Pan216]
MATLFLVCAIFGGTVLVIQFAMNLLGLGFDSVADLDVDLGGGDSGGDAGSVDMVDGVDHHHQTDPTQAHKGSSWGFAKYLTLQTIVAFLAFFGLGGLGSLEAGYSSPLSVLVGVGLGLLVMMALGWVFEHLHRLERDGSIRMRHIEGARGRVYLKIPGDGQGFGKVTLSLQGRTVEVPAKTQGPDLTTGTRCVVTRLLDQRTVEVVALGSSVEREVSQQA